MLEVILNREARFPLSLAEVKTIVTAASKLEKKLRGEVEINIIGNKKMAELNSRFRGIKATTDVLSFAWKEDQKFKGEMLGQIYLSGAKLKKQAKIWSVPVKEEAARILIHGLLHLVGYNHEEPKKAKLMFTKQERIVKRICLNVWGKV